MPPTVWSDALRLALTTFTVVPWPDRTSGGSGKPSPATAVLDRRAAGRAMAVAPWLGALLGAVLGAVLAGLREVTAAPIAGALTVGLAALLTRGLHLDGLADTVDALGSYRDRERALRIMKSPEVGPFGVVALVLVLLLQTLTLAQASVWAVVAAFAAGRCAITLACARGIPSARPDGLGAFVAGSVPRVVALVSAVAVAALAIPAVPGRPWQGPAVVALALFALLLLLRHLVRRLGGITGDVLGAATETVVTLVLIGLTLS
ncbi:adenosylcobinamide-GDP ribazoletransferase [Hamadaea flava]|uniref:Adenosylcobinamide-GDP ribazoletransferase n=1 Tax=Hamadaea flava TaxID=1742688 RepID=A0ABV8LTM7_9ACTN|nr:adenosylcobinamide-GDP ribazoletransferase [Hamadaea flava]MCP2327818.1 adenosylcobinamide-GDP ribazoletransferase [Hamadaea flava]